MPSTDLEIFKALGAMGTEITGYPLISTYEDFTPNLRSPRHGVFSDWLYDRFGIPALSSEVWDIETEVGMAKPQFFSTRPHNESEQIQFLEWADTYNSCAHQEWREFAHPQLGTVLLGGWDPFYIQRNPPPELISPGGTPQHNIYSSTCTSLTPTVSPRFQGTESWRLICTSCVRKWKIRGTSPLISPNRLGPWGRTMT